MHQDLFQATKRIKCKKKNEKKKREKSESIRKKVTFNVPSKRHHVVTESVISCPTSLPCALPHARKRKGGDPQLS